MYSAGAHARFVLRVTFCCTARLHRRVQMDGLHTQAPACAERSGSFGRASAQRQATRVSSKIGACPLHSALFIGWARQLFRRLLSSRTAWHVHQAHQPLVYIWRPRFLSGPVAETERRSKRPCFGKASVWHKCLSIIHHGLSEQVAQPRGASTQIPPRTQGHESAAAMRRMACSLYSVSLFMTPFTSYNPKYDHNIPKVKCITRPTHWHTPLL